MIISAPIQAVDQIAVLLETQHVLQEVSTH